MSAAHTPGPDQHPRFDTHVLIDGVTILKGSTAERDARLRHAAPQLAEALRALETATRLACCRESIRGRPENHAIRCNAAIDAANVARAALTAAGVTP